MRKHDNSQCVQDVLTLESTADHDLDNNPQNQPSEWCPYNELGPMGKLAVMKVLNHNGVQFTTEKNSLRLRLTALTADQIELLLIMAGVEQNPGPGSRCHIINLALSCLVQNQSVRRARAAYDKTNEDLIYPALSTSYKIIKYSNTRGVDVQRFRTLIERIGAPAAN